MHKVLGSSALGSERAARMMDGNGSEPLPSQCRGISFPLWSDWILKTLRTALFSREPLIYQGHRSPFTSKYCLRIILLALNTDTTQRIAASCIITNYQTQTRYITIRQGHRWSTRAHIRPNSCKGVRQPSDYNGSDCQFNPRCGDYAVSCDHRSRVRKCMLRDTLGNCYCCLSRTLACQNLSIASGRSRSPIL